MKDEDFLGSLLLANKEPGVYANETLEMLDDGVIAKNAELLVGRGADPEKIAVCARRYADRRSVSRLTFFAGALGLLLAMAGILELAIKDPASRATFSIVRTIAGIIVAALTITASARSIR